MKILMVCLGNICRSPLAEGILDHKVKQAGLNWEIDSAATLSYHIGEAPHFLSQKVAKKNGIDISKQKARLFVKEDFDRFDKIYVMANDVMDSVKIMAQDKFNTEKVDLLLNELYPGEDKDLIDPWYGPESSFYEVFDLVDKACDKIVEQYRTK